MAQVKIYTMNYCPYCTKAKSILTQRGIEFEEINVDDDDTPVTREALIQRSGMRTLPQIFHGKELIGGCSELILLDKKDQLESLKNSEEDSKP